MDELAGLFPLVAVVMFLILLCKFDKRYGKIEKDIDEIRRQIHDLSDSQKKVAADVLKVVDHLSEEMTEKKTVTVVAPEIDTNSAVLEESLPESVEPLPEEEIRICAEIEQETTEVFTNELLVAECTRKPVEEPVHEISQEEGAVEASMALSKKKINYEKFIGENLFGKIGILIFVIGVGFFVKYAIDKDWINETMRTVLGFLMGAGLLAVAERLQKKYRTFSSLLAGGAFAVFYLIIAIAFHYYHLFSQTTSFVLLVCVTILMSTLSVLYDRRELAIVSLVGGFLAPFIVSSGEGNYMVLFTYLSILNLGMFGLSMYKKWGELPIVSFAFTYIIMGVYLLSGDETNLAEVMGHLFVFVTLFYFIFLLPVLFLLRVEGKKMSRALLCVIIANNFIYLGFGSLFLLNMDLPFKATGFLSLFISIVNLALVIWLRKSKKDYKFLIFTMLGLVLTFVSVTIPIQLEGNFITLLWASEMVLLLWLYIKSGIRVYEYATFILVCLTFISFMMDVSYWIFNYTNSDILFMNSSFATTLFVGLATGAFAWLMGRYREFFSASRLFVYRVWNFFMPILSVAILYYAFMMEFCNYFQGLTRSGVMLLFTSASILTVYHAFRRRFPIKEYTTVHLLGMGVSVLVFMVCIWSEYGRHLYFWMGTLRWLSVVFVIANLYYVSRSYFTVIGQRDSFMVYLNVLAVMLWVTVVRFFLWQIGIEEFSAGFSLSLCVAGLVQMILGMRLHQKMLRIISLSVFGIVLLKLALADLWGMPAIGKILVFIFLGLILLVLSFLYQKLKNVLFKNDDDEKS